LGVFIFDITGCTRRLDPPVIPTLTTTIVGTITSSTATSGGNITADGGASITFRGVCWSTSHNPTTADSKTSEAIGTGVFTSNILGLKANSTYYLRAFATNSAGTAYGNEVSFKTTDLTITEITDIEGNVYGTVKIDNQIWIAQSLKTSKFNDGTTIPHVKDNSTWAKLTTPAYCWYDNDDDDQKIYGALYNWYAASSSNICPTGWHVPSDQDWTALATSLGGEAIAGGKMKETGFLHWLSPNTGATNSSGFTGLGGGNRNINGVFFNKAITGDYWSTTEYNTTEAWDRFLYARDQLLSREHYAKTIGFFIRCVKN
jgi:uncharacterized protein (TIGR02145 family)